MMWPFVSEWFCEVDVHKSNPSVLGVGESKWLYIAVSSFSCLGCRGCCNRANFAKGLVVVDSGGRGANHHHMSEVNDSSVESVGI